MRNILIIGAGLSGTLVAVNLLKADCPDGLKIWLVDRNAPDALGPAYSTEEAFLLNVPAGIMGAYSGRPGHFLKWVQARGYPAEAGDFLPRKLFRAYIQEQFQEALAARSGNCRIEMIRGEATDAEMTEGRVRVSVRGHGDILADRVILAIGNARPANPPVRQAAVLQDERYFGNPWDVELSKRIQPDDRILFVGTGQTMMELATVLLERGHRGPITAISRRGLLPMAHQSTDPYPDFFAELEGKKSILQLLRIVRKHIRLAQDQGSDPRAVIDSLRPHSPGIWMNLPVEEKRRFIRHLFRFWEIIRSRVPLESAKRFEKYLASGKVSVLAGTLTNVQPHRDRLDAKYVDRKSRRPMELPVDKVINCIGPNLDYEQRDEPLVQQLLRRGMIRCDPLHVGLDAFPDGTLIQADGTPSTVLSTLGLPLRGILWETLAVPEIRAQAAELVRLV